MPFVSDFKILSITSYFIEMDDDKTETDMHIAMNTTITSVCIEIIGYHPSVVRIDRITI